MVRKQFVRPQHYLVNIAIIEGRHFAWPSMDSAVLVRVSNQKKCTGIQHKTDCPFYNEYFVFEFYCTFEELLDKHITFTVIQPKHICRPKKILGYTSLDVATVYDEPNHHFYHKWAIVSAPANDPTGGPRGYLKVDISVIAKGETQKIPAGEVLTHEEIEGNLLLPEGSAVERQRANFVFNVYRGEGLGKLKGVSWCSDSKVHFEKNPPSIFVQIGFVGLKGKTSIQKHTCNPVWNERIILSELFPPLCQRIKIELYFTETGSDEAYAIHYLNLHTISNEKEHGFLPTYGPSFIYFYNNNIYIGKLLLSMTTELQDNSFSITKSVIVESIPPISEGATTNFDTVLLYASILEVTAIPKKYSKKSISFQLAFGSEIDLDSKAKGDSPSTNKTMGRTPTSHEGVIWYLPFGTEKPCMSVTNVFPDFKRRMYNSNMISKTAINMKKSLEGIEQLLMTEHWQNCSDELTSRLEDMLDTLSSGCQKYLDISKASTTMLANDLDNHRLEFCLREMEDIEVFAKILYSNKCKKKSFDKCQKLYKRLECFIEDPQHCWPDVIIYMLAGSRRISSYRIPAREIAYSVVEEETGINCGVVQNIYFKVAQPKTEKQIHSFDLLCKMSVFLWAGLERHKSVCQSCLPPGYESAKDDGQLVPDISTSETLMFNCRAHIFQGRICPGLDDTGLADSFVRVTIGDHAKETKVKKQSLNPTWDQTLLFQDFEVYGNQAFIKKYPPVVIMELLDKDKCFKNEYIGRVIFDPLIKLSTESYSPPLFPPTLKWHDISNGDEITGEVLAAVELLEKTGETGDIELQDPHDIIRIPSDIRPILHPYRVEVLFWGVRDLKKVHFLAISKPKITVEITDEVLHSDTLVNTKKCLNFITPVKFMDVELPIQEPYLPHLCIKMYDARSFGRYTYCGTNMTPIQEFVYHPIEVGDRTRIVSENPTDSSITKSTCWDPNCLVISDISIPDKTLETSRMSMKPDKPPAEEKKKKKLLFKPEKPPAEEKKKKKWSFKPEKPPEEEKKKKKWSFKEAIKKCFRSRPKCKTVCGKRKKGGGSIDHIDDDEEENTDWWTKFYKSVEDAEKQGPHEELVQNKCHIIKIYPDELENQPEFGNFNDFISSYPLYKGKRTGDETVDEENITGVFKGAIRIYPWPPPESAQYVTINGSDVANGTFQDFPVSEPLQFVVRVYCVKGVSLRPKDTSGRSDPYICISMNEKNVKDRDHYIPRQTSPVFGRCFELRGSFPNDNTMTISVWDWDATSSDDLIGETVVDIENRFYTCHRAMCGLSPTYEEQGFATWRDQQRPTGILEQICRQYKLPEPVYHESAVTIASKQFAIIPFTGSGNPLFDQEVLALNALRRWHEYPLVGFHLVPEHIETRSLYHPSRPGIEQGKLQMWVDIFPIKDLPMPQQVDISPRKPSPYELRVIIWNADDVTLQEDDYFLGEKKSDVFVKGWMVDADVSQNTDVHYRSISGEANFNWRFVFPFDYLRAENKLVLKKKESLFALDETEMKMPCRLSLQIWDNDTVSKHDFLGSVTLELAHLPRGAKNTKTCSLKQLEPNAPTVNLFKTKRVKGWWPMRNVNKETNTEIIGGKIEAELELVTGEEAEKDPVGLGRSEPHALPKPKRPDVSFSWFKNPFKACKYMACKHYRWKIIKGVIFLLLILIVFLAIYSVPGYSVKKLFGV